MKKDLLLAFDVGPGSVRAALVAETGEILAFAAKERDQIIPQFRCPSRQSCTRRGSTRTSLKHLMRP
jgi:sugar (pentulose or hexulose) kinase